MNTRTASAASLFLLIVGCSDPQVDPEPQGAVDLAAAMGVDDAFPVGVTVAPDTGERYVLDALHGLWKLDGDDAERIYSIDAFPEADVWPQSEWTDIAALGDGRFALTAVADGYLLDVERGTLMQHFCYEPGWGEWGETEQQLTTSLGYDPVDNALIAQPQTQEFTADGMTPLGSAVGVYDASLGGDAPESWYELSNASFLATGMAVESSDALLFVEADGSLHRYRMDDIAPTPLGVLEGTERVEGATLDGDVLLVVDAGGDWLISYPVR